MEDAILNKDFSTFCLNWKICLTRSVIRRSQWGAQWACSLQWTPVSCSVRCWDMWRRWTNKWKTQYPTKISLRFILNETSVSLGQWSEEASGEHSGNAVYSQHKSTVLWEAEMCGGEEQTHEGHNTQQRFLKICWADHEGTWIRYMSHDMTKPTKWLCAQRRLRSVWASAQSDQSLHCALNG